MDDLKLPNGAILRIVLEAVDKVIVGFFDLSKDDRTWTFKYSEKYKEAGFMPLNDFPIVGYTYGHQACTKWLAERVRVNDKKKCLDLSDAIYRGNGRVSEHLELHVIQ